MDAERLLIAANIFLCAFGWWLCLCRLVMMGSQTKLAIAAQYALWMACFTGSALSWTYGEPASVTQLLMGASVVIYLLMGWAAWRYGAPRYTVTEVR